MTGITGSSPSRLPFTNDSSKFKQVHLTKSMAAQGNSQSGNRLLRRAKKTPSPPPPATNGIIYHGGPVMTATTGPTVYPIFFGNKWSSAQMGLVNGFIGSLGGTSWFNMMTTYTLGTSATATKVTRAIVLSSNIVYMNTTSKFTTKLTDANIFSIVEAAMSTLSPNGVDPDGIYLVLTSSDVTETSGFCTTYCGWHSNGTYTNADVKYGFIGDGSVCLPECSEQTTSPNGDAGVDGMISVIAHEISEATTDPDLNAWYDSEGNECADKCAWTFGTTHSVAGKGEYNISIGTKNYLIQQNWVNAKGGYCSMSY